MSSFITAVDFEGAATGLKQHGITSDVSTTITAGNTYNMDITLNKTTYKYARIMIRRQTNTLLSREYCVIWCFNEASKGNSISNNLTYAVSYSMAQNDSYLSQQMFSSVANSYIRVADAYITSSTLRITFFNADGSTRTLNAYVDWEVSEG